MPNSFAADGTGLLLIADGIGPVLRFDGYETTAENAGLVAPTTAPTATPSGVGSMSGGYFVYASFIRDDGFESSLGPAGGDFIVTNNAQIDYTNIPISPDPRVVGRRIYRNTDQQSLTVYLDVEIDDNSTTTASSSLSDTLLQAGLAFPLFNNENILQTLNNNPPPDTKPFVAFWLNRCFLAGYTDYAEGSCEVSTGSLTVQGRGTIWKANWAGRFIYVDGGNATYEIASVNETLQQITLTKNFTGVTNLFAGYAIRPSPAEASLMYYSQANSPESWPPLNSFGIPDEDDVTTGLMPMYGFLYILKRNSIYKFTSQNDPALDGDLFLSVRRGCVNHRCWVVIDNAAFLLDQRGIHRFTGGQQSVSISDPVQDLFRDGGKTPINWGASRYFHAAHSPNESTIRFFVAFRGDYLPRHALAFNYVLKRWWIEEYHRPIGASALGQAGKTAHGWGTSGEQLYLGSDACSVVAHAQASPDLVLAPVAQNLPVLAAGFESITVQGQPDVSWVGSPVVHRSNAIGGLQTRRITAVNGQVLTIAPPWLMVPKADDEAIIGGFPYQMRTQFLRFIDAEDTVERNLEVIFDRNKGSKFDIEIEYDARGKMEAACNISSIESYGVESVKGRTAMRVDMGNDNEFAQVRFDGLRESSSNGERTPSFTLTGVGGNKKDAIAQVVVKGVTS